MAPPESIASAGCDLQNDGCCMTSTESTTLEECPKDLWADSTYPGGCRSPTSSLECFGGDHSPGRVTEASNSGKRSKQRAYYCAQLAGAFLRMRSLCEHSVETSAIDMEAATSPDSLSYSSSPASPNSPHVCNSPQHLSSPPRGTPPPNDQTSSSPSSASPAEGLIHALVTWKHFTEDARRKELLQEAFLQLRSTLEYRNSIAVIAEPNRMLHRSDKSGLCAGPRTLKRRRSEPIACESITKFLKNPRNVITATCGYGSGLGPTPPRPPGRVRHSSDRPPVNVKALKSGSGMVPGPSMCSEPVSKAQLLLGPSQNGPPPAANRYGRRQAKAKKIIISAKTHREAVQTALRCTDCPVNLATLFRTPMLPSSLDTLHPLDHCALLVENMYVCPLCDIDVLTPSRQWSHLKKHYELVHASRRRIMGDVVIFPCCQSHSLADDDRLWEATVEAIADAEPKCKILTAPRAKKVMKKLRKRLDENSFRYAIEDASIKLEQQFMAPPGTVADVVRTFLSRISELHAALCGLELLVGAEVIPQWMMRVGKKRAGGPTLPKQRQRRKSEPLMMMSPDPPSVRQRQNCDPDVASQSRPTSQQTDGSPPENEAEEPKRKLQPIDWSAFPETPEGMFSWPALLGIIPHLHCPGACGDDDCPEVFISWSQLMAHMKELTDAADMMESEGCVPGSPPSTRESVSEDGDIPLRVTRWNECSQTPGIEWLEQCSTAEIDIMAESLFTRVPNWRSCRRQADPARRWPPQPPLQMPDHIPLPQSFDTSGEENSRPRSATPPAKAACVGTPETPNADPFDTDLCEPLYAYLKLWHARFTTAPAVERRKVKFNETVRQRTYDLETSLIEKWGCTIGPQAVPLGLRCPILNLRTSEDDT